MARTALPGVLIQNNGTQLGVSGFTIIDLVSGISATDGGNGVADITVSGGGGGLTYEIDGVTPVTSGSSITLDLTTLAHTFVAILGIYKNGQLLNPSDATFGWTITGNSATVLNAANTDEFDVEYSHA